MKCLQMGSLNIVCSKKICLPLGCLKLPKGLPKQGVCDRLFEIDSFQKDCLEMASSQIDCLLVNMLKMESL